MSFKAPLVPGAKSERNEEQFWDSTNGFQPMPAWIIERERDALMKVPKPPAKEVTSKFKLGKQRSTRVAAHTFTPSALKSMSADIEILAKADDTRRPVYVAPEVTYERRPARPMPGKQLRAFPYKNNRRKFMKTTSPTKPKSLKSIVTDENKPMAIPGVRKVGAGETSLLEDDFNSLTDDPNYLRIDQSKLPLYKFDSTEFDDRKPEEWLIDPNGRTPAKALYYSNGKWDWESCRVLSYDQDSDRYNIQFDAHPSRAKKVSRINLQFDHESKEKFNARIEAAMLARSQCKSALRLLHYLQDAPVEDVTPMSERWMHNIFDKLAFSLTFLDKRKVTTMSHEMLTQVSSEYRTMVKYANLRQCILVTKDEAVAEEYKRLNLPEFPPVLPPPRQGKIRMPANYVTFGQSLKMIKHGHYTAVSSLTFCLQWLNDLWHTEFASLRMFDKNFSEKVALPCSLEDFTIAQTHACTDVKKRLETHWRHIFIETMLDNVYDSFSFFVKDIEEYNVGILKRVLCMINQQMKTQLRNMVTDTVRDYLDFLRSFGFDSTLCSDALQPCEGDKVLRTPLLALDVEAVHDRNDNTQVTVVFNPSLDEVDVGLQDVLRRMAESIRVLTTVDVDLVTLLDLPVRPILDISLDRNTPNLNPDAAAVEETIQSAVSRIHDIVSSLRKRPEELLLQYQDCSKVMTVGIDTGVAEFKHFLKQIKTERNGEKSSNTDTNGGGENKPENNQGLDNKTSTERSSIKLPEASEIETSPPDNELKIHEWVNEHHTIVNAVRDVSAEEVDFFIGRMRFKHLQEKLYTSGSLLTNALLDAVVEDVRVESEEIALEFSSMMSTIQEKPENEKALDDLLKYMEKSKTAVTILEGRMSIMHSRLNILSYFTYQTDYDDFCQAYKTGLWPLKIQMARQEADMNIIQDKEIMIAKLEKERQTFEERLKTFRPRIHAFRSFESIENMSQIVTQTEQLDFDLKNAVEIAEDLQDRENTIGLGAESFPLLTEYKNDFLPHLKLWIMYSDFQRDRMEWIEGPFENLDADLIESYVTKIFDSTVKLRKDLKQYSGPFKIVSQLYDNIRQFQEEIPVIKALASRAMRHHHWEQLAAEMGRDDVVPEEGTTTMEHYFQIGIKDHIAVVLNISIVAEKQFGLENALKAMKREWNPIEFECIRYDFGHATSPDPEKLSFSYIIRGIDDVVALLDDHLVKVQTMRASPFIKAGDLEKQAKLWEKKLQNLQSLIDEWMACQRSWMYLKPIFSSEDIVTKLPQEARRFAWVDALWLTTMAETAECPTCIDIAGKEALLPKFKGANERLDLIEKGLNVYLETKRSTFPRFYFLGNDELLEILSQAKVPQAVQPFLGKCFEGINAVHFEEAPSKRENDLSITRMMSQEEETVDLSEKIYPSRGENKGNVENWLLQLETIMAKTIWQTTQKATAEYTRVRPFEDRNFNSKSEIERSSFALQWPAQVVIGVTQVFWTREVTASIRRGGDTLKQYLSYLMKNIDQMVIKVRGKLTKLERKSLGALSTIDVHARDVVKTMVQSGVASINAFEWTRELRYYWEPYANEGKKKSKKEIKNVVVRIVNAEQKYRYEYLGNSSRLVITPLTDRCYRTMIGAVALMYGGAPEGPAGTGKTETVKDLSKAVAIQCVVFNCSDGLDYIQMAKFFKGLAGCGAWCCFDEFNRINIEVLSVIAQQILTIQDAKRRRLKVFQFSGSLCALKVDCNCFITMNPGYAGRAELPDNLKALFRPCAMMVPNYTMIAEIRLFSFGFQAAPALARKITMTLTLSSLQLSSQKHYDYGMRAVNTILVAAGNLRQRLGDNPLWSEDKIVMRSINEVNLPKFTLNDLPLFKGITSDLFPGVELPEAKYDTLNDVLTIVMRERNLQATSEFRLKCIQLYETVNVRHGLMVVGKTFSGKTEVVHTLANALCKINAANQASKSPDFRLREIFNEFDEDGSGSIDASEFQTLAHACGETLTDEEAQETLERLDDDKNGTLEFEEFKAWMDSKKNSNKDDKSPVGFVQSAKEAYLKEKLEARFKAKQESRVIERSERAVKVRSLNPKAIAANQLYGNFDPNTHEWTDGVLACMYRSAVKDKSDDRNWIVFDGPVDAVWIEDMNTVLDDNRKLCLMSGEIIKMSTRMTMMFEAEDLDQASPATVSRVGMVFTEPERLGTAVLLESWLVQEFPTADKVRSTIRDIFNWSFPPSVWFVRSYCSMPTPVSTMEMAASLLRLLGALLRPINCKIMTEEITHAFYCISLYWSVGAAVDSTGRGIFDNYMKRVLNGRVVGDREHEIFRSLHPAYAKTYEHPSKVACAIPDDNTTLFDYSFLVKNKKTTWTKWSDSPLVTKFKIEKGAEFSSIVVPTVSTAVNFWLIDTLVINNGGHVLFTGDTGTGKTLSVMKKLRTGVSKDKFVPFFMSFSARTSANQTQDIIDGWMRKRRKGIYGPPVGKTGIIFVDDLNMPAKEEYGAQPPIELLRQWMDLGGWADRKSKDKGFIKVVDIQFIAAMGPPGGARSLITQRYMRHFNIVNLTPFDKVGLTHVFGKIVRSFVSEKGFSPPVTRVINLTVDATAHIYNRMAEEMRPTPMKSHYLFNLRDFSSVFQGMLRVSSEYLDVPKNAVRLWAHECQRVFSDRLVDDDDRKWFRHEMENEVAPKIFNMKWKDVMDSADAEDGIIPLPLMFGSYLDPNAEEKMYTDVGMHGRHKIEKVMQNYLEEFNISSGDGSMDLVLFQNALEHITRVCRVLGQKRGNALLVGVGGSGRKSLTTMASFISEQKLVQIELTRTYGMLEWREDLKKIVRLAGVEGMDTTFMIVDTQIVDEAFVEDINNLLNNGEVPNLFPQDELVALMEELTDSPAIKKMEEMMQNNNDGNSESASVDKYSLFVNSCRQNLHLVLCFSPIGDIFRTRLRMFPALVNCCYIDLFTAWPKDALESVAKRFLREVPLEDTERLGVVKVCVDMQSRVIEMSEQYLREVRRKYYVTPSSYLELINTFKVLINQRRTQILDASKRYSNGLEKLFETAKDVEKMQEELTELQPKLVVATKETDDMLVVINEKQAEANEMKTIVQGEEKICAEQAAVAKAIADDCQEQLDEAIPALNAAQKALSTLKKNDMDEVKAMKKPPGGVRLTLEAVCILMNVKPEKIKDPEGGSKKILDYWGPAVKHLLNDTKFLKKLQKYDKDNIKDSMTASVLPYTLRDDFQPDRIAKASKAAAGLCKWVHAMMKYTKVYKVVLPKKLELEKATSELKDAQAVLEGKQATVREVEERVANLKKQLDVAMARKESLKNEVDDCAAKLDRAERLMSGLGGERKRWQEQVKTLSSQYDNVTGDVLLSAGIVAYLGVFTTTYRSSCVSLWANMLELEGIPCSPGNGFSLENVLGNAVQIRSWTLAKLPNDSFSINNAIIMDNSSRWPLMIDPQGQANRWIRNMEAEKSVKATKQSNSGFIRTMENAIQFGTPIIIENVPEWLDPVLNPVLMKKIVMVGNTPHITLGDNQIPYDSGFRLYLTTKLPNPHFSPDICVMLTILNFASTPEGLEDQMLGVVVKAEAPDLEKQNEQLVIEGAKNQKQLKEIEDSILRLLDSAEGNILDDEKLVNTLSASKVTSNKIAEKVEVAKRVKANIDTKRMGFVPIARRAASMFFCINSLSNIDPMYQWSMQFFTDLFLLAISKAPKPDPKAYKGKTKEQDTLAARLLALTDTFQYILYCNVCRSLFERHKLLFSFLLCTTIKMEKSVKNQNNYSLLDPSLLRFFLTGNTDLSVDEPVPPGQDWLTEKIWGNIVSLSKLPEFSGFLEKFTMNISKWKQIYESQSPVDDLKALLAIEENPIENDEVNPVSSKDSYSKFETLCILRCLRLDKVIQGVQAFIGDSLGAKFIDPPAFDLNSSFEDSNCCSPIVFVLSTGADPTADLSKLADQLGFRKRLTSISLGQGQGIIAENAVSDAVDKGNWVCLQNCHLSISWLPTLERICETFSPDFSHPEFRLWLTTMPCPEFPVSVLQSSIKITKEPPKGIRASILGSYLTFDKDWFEGSLFPGVFKRLLYSLCFFHASILQRAKFGPLGWNKAYEFSESDRTICKDQLRIFVDSTEIEQKFLDLALANQKDEAGPRALPENVFKAVVDSLPFDALKYLVGQCNYGGRVTDAQDRRTMLTILDDFYSPSVLKKGYSFSETEAYLMPAPGNISEYIKTIRKLPLVDEGPEMYGLHANANISCALAESTTLLDTVLSLQPRSSGGESGDTWDSQVTRIATAIEASLPSAFRFDVEAATIKFPIVHEESLNTVLTQELMRFNGLLLTIDESIIEIQKAIKGIVLMSESLEKVGEAMVNGAVPSMWQAVAYPSLKPLNGWTKDLSKRLAFFTKWIENGSPNVFWFSGLFFTQSFITGTLQNYARRQHFPIDEIAFDFEILHPSKGTAQNMPSSAPTGSYIYGLYLDGAKWNSEGSNKMKSGVRGCLTHSEPKVLYSSVPVIWMQPKLTTDIEPIAGEEPGGTAHVYLCPTYKTSARWGTLSTTGLSTNFVINFRVPMSPEETRSDWIKAGVAMLTQLD